MTKKDTFAYSDEWTVGQRYSFCTREECIQSANHAKAMGFEVRYGISTTGNYYFEILDHFSNIMKG